tara:strand:- start:297 stop:599 length:303 start_codon:yes stop_codon:yes gene_type:complete
MSKAEKSRVLIQWARTREDLNWRHGVEIGGWVARLSGLSVHHRRLEHQYLVKGHPYHAHFDGTYGHGTSPDEALSNLIAAIAAMAEAACQELRDMSKSCP